MSDLCSLTAVQLLEKYVRRELSPVEVTKAVLARIEKLNPKLNAFCLVSEKSLDDAKASEARWMAGQPRGLLDGVPVSIKDLLLTKGWPTLRGSKTVDPKGPWNDDAPAVARLREHGAVLLGKTTTPEFGWKGVTDSPLTGITRNPWNPAKTPGGSSGGARRRGRRRHGPARGRHRRRRLDPHPVQLHRPVRHQAVVRPRAGLAGSRPSAPWRTSARSRTASPTRALMLNVPRPARRARLARPALRGARLAHRPRAGRARPAHRLLARPRLRQGRRRRREAGSKRNQGLFRPGCKGRRERSRLREPRSDLPHATGSPALRFLLKGLPEEKHNLIDPGLREVAALGEKITAHEVLDAQMKRGALGAHMNQFHRDYDLLVTPTLSVPAFDAGKEFPEGVKRWIDWTPFSFPFNLTQQPAASIPCGLTPSGLPVGLHIVGPRYADALVLSRRSRLRNRAPHRTAGMQPGWRLVLRHECFRGLTCQLIFLGRRQPIHVRAP